jgi:hypothetical protein
MRRFVCVLTASKGVVSGSGASMVVGRVPEMYGVRMHETIRIKFQRLRWPIKRAAQWNTLQSFAVSVGIALEWLTC